MDTNKLLIHWHAYCNGSDEFESCEFLTLLHDDPRLTHEQLLDAFQYFEKGETIANAVLNAQSIKFDNNYLPITKDAAASLVRQQLSEILDKLDVSLDDCLDKSLITNAPPQLTNDKEYFFKLFLSDDNVSSVADNEYAGFIHEEIPSGFFKDPVDGLHESLYGFTNNTLLTFHFLQPILKFDVNLDNYFRLWQSGVDYALTKEKLVLYTKPHSKVR